MIAVAHTESVLNAFVSKFAALCFGVFFGYLTFLEAKSAEPSNVRLALCAVPTFFCLAMLCTDAFFNVIAKAVPFLPAKWRGGTT